MRKRILKKAILTIIIFVILFSLKGQAWSKIEKIKDKIGIPWSKWQGIRDDKVNEFPPIFPLRREYEGHLDSLSYGIELSKHGNVIFPNSHSHQECYIPQTKHTLKVKI